MLSKLKSIYNSPDLPGSFLLKPSSHVHNFLRVSKPTASFLKKGALLISEIALQTILSPITTFGFLIKLTGVPSVLRHNERMEKKTIADLINAQKEISKPEDFKADSSLKIPSDDNVVQESNVTFNGEFLLSDEVKQNKIFEDIKRSLSQSINNASQKFMRVPNVSLITESYTNVATQTKTARLGFRIAHHRLPGEIDSFSSPEALEKEAKSGNGRAAFELAQLAIKNLPSTPTLITDVVKWYTLGVELGDPSSMYELEYLYRAGYGVAKDEEKAFELLTKAVEAGSQKAMYSLGYRYIHGDGITKKDEEKTFESLTKAAEVGNPHAMNILGECYICGSGITKKDEKKALEWFTRAANAGNPDAMCNLGLYYDSVARDVKKAIEWFTKAAEADSDDAMNSLGWHYDNGVGVPVDSKKAVELYRKAATADNKDALNNLGQCYRFANGVDKDEERAVALYQRAVMTNSSEARENLVQSNISDKPSGQSWDTMVHKNSKWLPNSEWLPYEKQ